MKIEDKKKIQKILKEIYEFVDKKFNVEDEEEIQNIKNELTTGQIKEFDKMLRNYNKELKKIINAEKRKIAQREAQKAYKNIQTNIKVEYYKKIEDFANENNLSMSMLIKNAIKAYMAQKPQTQPKPLPEPKKEEITALKAQITQLKKQNEELKKDYEELKQNNKINNEELKKLRPSWSALQQENKNLKEQIKALKPQSFLQKLLFLFKS